MMFTRAQVRKQKSNGSSSSGGSNQRSKPSRSQQQKQQEQQQYAYDVNTKKINLEFLFTSLSSQKIFTREFIPFYFQNRYKPSNYSAGSSNSSVVGLGTSICSSNINSGTVRIRERDRDCNSSTADRSSGYYSDPFSTSTSTASLVPHHSRYSSYELPRQHSKEDSYSPHRPYLERNATYVDRSQNQATQHYKSSRCH